MAFVQCFNFVHFDLRCVCVCVCVCMCVLVYVIYEDTNLYNDMCITLVLQLKLGL